MDDLSFDVNPQVGPVPKGFKPGQWYGDAKPNPAYRVDVNRGCIIRYIGSTGEAIYMYVDTPGVFYNEVGRVVSAEAAHAAGYDTEYLLKIRRRNDARNAAIAAVDAEFAQSQGRKILREAGEYRLVEVREGFYNVEFEDGTVLNARGPVPLDIAENLFRQCLGDEPEGEASQPASPGTPGKKGK